MAEHLLDTNVLSKIFYADAEVENFIDGLNSGIETVVYIECIQGSVSKRDKELIKSSLSKLRLSFESRDRAASDRVDRQAFRIERFVISGCSYRSDCYRVRPDPRDL